MFAENLHKKLSKSEETQFLTCTFMVPVGSSAKLELVLAAHSYHVIVYAVYEPRHEKTCLRGLRPGLTQTGLLSFRSQLES